MADENNISKEVVNAPPSYQSPIDRPDSFTGKRYDTAEQVYTSLLIAEALTYSREQAVFTALSDSINLPLHMGKKLEQLIEIPLLDDRNQNDQGIDAQGAVTKNGNLYGSSTNIGQIDGALPRLTEEGGRRNRVGFTRIKREGTIEPYGFFTELTNQQLMFDNQADYGRSVVRRAIDGAIEMQETMTQMKILQNIGTQIFTGGATSIAEISPSNQGKTPADANGSVLTPAHLARLDEILDGVRMPYSESLLSGSRNTDTKTLRTSRIAFAGPHLINYLRTVKDSFGNPAFIDVNHYSSQGNVLTNEVGSIGGFRIIKVRRMLDWSGQGAEASEEEQIKYRTSVGQDGKARINVYPFLVLGDEAYATTSLEMSKGQYRLNLISKYPSRDTADQHHDPYGERGFTSLKFWWGFLPLKTERIACVYTALPII